MSELNFFQKYSQRENHITNNVLLMLRMLYRSHPNKLQAVIEGIFTKASLEKMDLRVGPTFQQQVGSSKSIPDGVISQQPFVIMIEVKPGANWDREQIKRHIASAKARSSQNSVLMLLSTEDEPDFDDKLLRRADKANVTLLHTTFETLINLMESEEVVAPHETDLQDIIEDLKEIFWAEDLLDDKLEMFAFGCSRTLEWNLKYNMYYDDLSRPNKAKVLTGFYANKEIHGIGRVAATVTGNPEKGFEVERPHETIPDKGIIDRVIKATKPIADDLSGDTRRWYVYDKVHPTSFKKSTRYGYFQGVWIYLGAFLNDDTDPYDLKGIAKQLRGKTFDNSRGYDD